ncbi:hypothetical protein BXO88_09120 [Oribacterium sp. C9]|uniref:hypothetical protein n=1 Tax=Oribacterium sp. C9 TaxID=1943579 RepID=UPI00098E9334|nr:hypothetical protein [Oribacterium sp. C9]OON86196.1 hypothetical protein BXO88_09120 [Oribacterium sp. C9]
MTLIERIREKLKCSEDIEKAVDSAVVSCIEDGILKEFLIAHRAEVIDMCLTEYDEKTFVNGIKEEGREERDREKITELLQDGKTPKEIADFCKYPMELIKIVQESMMVVK